MDTPGKKPPRKPGRGRLEESSIKDNASTKPSISGSKYTPEELVELEAQYKISSDSLSADALEQLAMKLPGRSANAIRLWFTRRRKQAVQDEASELADKVETCDDASSKTIKPRRGKRRNDIEFPGLVEKAVKDARPGNANLGKENLAKKEDALSLKDTTLSTGEESERIRAALDNNSHFLEATSKTLLQAAGDLDLTVDRVIEWFVDEYGLATDLPIRTSSQPPAKVSFMAALVPSLLTVVKQEVSKGKQINASSTAPSATNPRDTDDSSDGEDATDKEAYTEI
ncbi:hypothetical protein BDZ45DRAFT_752783 [Acephala macrosclerotiorum]|nr:hypothetical protein BDZ45DRAFT_752783 [Acephala macrosclerotiorum]